MQKLKITSHIKRSFLNEMKKIWEKNLQGFEPFNMCYVLANTWSNKE